MGGDFEPAPCILIRCKPIASHVCPACISSALRLVLDMPVVAFFVPDLGPAAAAATVAAVAEVAAVAAVAAVAGGVMYEDAGRLERWSWYDV